MSTAVPRAALRSIFATLAGVPEANVIWEGESVPFANTRTNITLDVLARRPVGIDEVKREYPTPDTTRITTTGRRVLSIPHCLASGLTVRVARVRTSLRASPSRDHEARQRQRP